MSQAQTRREPKKGDRYRNWLDGSIVEIKWVDRDSVVFKGLHHGLTRVAHEKFNKSYEFWPVLHNGDVFVSRNEPDNVIQVTKWDKAKAWVYYDGQKDWGALSEDAFLRTFEFVRRRRIIRDDPLLWASVALILLYIGVALLFGGIEVTDGDPEKGSKISVFWYGTWFWTLTLCGIFLTCFFLLELRAGFKKKESAIVAFLVLPGIVSGIALLDAVIRRLL